MENGVSFIGMKRSKLSYLGGGVIVAIIALAVARGANACHHNAETVEQTSTELPLEADEKTEIEV